MTGVQTCALPISGIGGAMVRKENVAANDFDAVAARAACYVAVVERL